MNRNRTGEMSRTRHENWSRVRSLRDAGHLYSTISRRMIKSNALSTTQFDERTLDLIRKPRAHAVD